MNSQPSDKSSERTFRLSENIDRRLLKYDIEKLKDSLNKFSQKTLEKAGISEAELFVADIGLCLGCNKDANELINKLMTQGHNLTTYSYIGIFGIYSKTVYHHLFTRIYSNKYDIIYDRYTLDTAIWCELDMRSYKIICTNYNDEIKKFTLYDPPQSYLFSEDIKKSTLDILFDILDPRELTNKDNQDIKILARVSRYLKKQREENPKISIKESEFKYNDNVFDIYMFWYRSPRPKL